MKLQCLALIVVILLTRYAAAATPALQIADEMDKSLIPLLKKTGWVQFIKDHPTLFSDATIETQPSVNTDDLNVTIGGEKYKVGLGARSVVISAPPKIVVSVINEPRFFQALYGLDKPADIFPINKDGTYQARIFKLVPGIETQDFILDYKGHWEDGSWIGQSKMVKDERGFALRNNVKIVEPHGSGSIYREVALFFPLRWWMHLFPETVRSVTKSEMTKLNKAIKCAAEKVQGAMPGAMPGTMTNEIGKICFKEAQR